MRISETVHRRIEIFGLLRECRPQLLAGAVTVQILLGLLPLCFIVTSSDAVGHVVGALEHGLHSASWDALQRDLLLGAIALVLQQVLAPLQQLLGRRIRLDVDKQMYDRLMRASIACTTLEALELPATRAHAEDACEGLRLERESPGAAAAASLTLVARYGTFAGAALMTAMLVHWVAALALVAAAFVLRRAHQVGYRKFVAIVFAQVPQRRRALYLRNLSLGTAVAKESRVYGMAGWLAQHTSRAGREAMGPVWVARIRIYVVAFVLAAAFAALCTAGVFWWAVARDLAVGSLTLVFQAVLLGLTFGSFFEDFDPETEYGYRTYQELRRFESVVGARQNDDGRCIPPPSWQAIQFENVSFTYSESDRLVISNLNLRIRAGESVAIVGVNGVGKTTLLKLLCRFNEPTKGRITMDGIDIRTFDGAAWQRRISAIFQDFAKYEVSALDNIRFGAVDDDVDLAGVRELARKTGAFQFLDKLPNGFSTTLSGKYADGTELSGGQWQRVALTRACLSMTAGASILLLDEPTANLDVRAEAAFIDQFLALTEGSTTIIVSHRFSTVRMADRIVVLDESGICEDGSHEELMSLRGQYAKLFRLQASKFGGDIHIGASDATPA